MPFAIGSTTGIVGFKLIIIYEFITVTAPGTEFLVSWLLGKVIWKVEESPIGLSAAILFGSFRVSGIFPKVSWDSVLSPLGLSSVDRVISLVRAGHGWN